MALVFRVSTIAVLYIDNFVNNLIYYKYIPLINTKITHRIPYHIDYEDLKKFIITTITPFTISGTTIFFYMVKILVKF